MLSYKQLNARAGRHAQSLPTIYEYVQDLYDAQESVVKSSMFEHVGENRVLCRYENCKGSMISVRYGLCAGHEQIRLRLYENYHLDNFYECINANSSLKLFRCAQLRELYRQEYNIPPDYAHDFYILRLFREIDFDAVRIRGELQSDVLIHACLRRKFRMGSVWRSFEFYGSLLASACSCCHCRLWFPENDYSMLFEFVSWFVVKV